MLEKSLATFLVTFSWLKLPNLKHNIQKEAWQVIGHLVLLLWKEEPTSKDLLFSFFYYHVAEYNVLVDTNIRPFSPRFFLT